MIEVQSTLDGTVKSVEQNKAYMIDFSRLNSVNDLVLILASMGIMFPFNHPNIQQLTPFLNLDNPIPMEEPKNKAEFVPLNLKKVSDEANFRK